jgi:putative holliday junction resolvase
MTSILGFDYGESRIGVAIGNTITGTASPLLTLQGSNRNEQLDKVAGLVKEWSPSHFVIGLPSHSADENKPHPLAERARSFAQQLEERFKRPIHFVDERYTSVQAEQLLREQGKRPSKDNKAMIDALAAQIILQQYLDASVDGNVDGNTDN